MTDFRKLKVWNKAHALVLTTHRLTERMSGAKYVSLRSQMMRAAMSITANIAEGRSRILNAGSLDIFGLHWLPHRNWSVIIKPLAISARFRVQPALRRLTGPLKSRKCCTA